MEEEAVFPLFLCHKFSSILGEAQNDGNIPPQMLSRFRSIQRLMSGICSKIRDDHEVLYDLIDAVSECRIFAGQKGFVITRKMMRRLDNIERQLKEVMSRESQSAATMKETEVVPCAINGLEGEGDKMETWLMDRAAFKAIGIVGTRCGSGKTSLAHNVFSRVESVFSPRIWVCLSDVYGKEDVVDPRTRVVIHILKEVGQDVSELGDADYSIVKLLRKLHQKLMGKRYLIVLDDAWEMEEWWGDLGYTLPRGYPMGEFLSHGLPKRSPGGAVIVTSRWESVAKRMIGNDKYLIRLENKLSDEVCWEIFCQHLEAEARRLKQDVISTCDALPLPPKPDFISTFYGLSLAKILKQDVISICDAKILKQDVILICDGLPLAAKILAHALLSKNKKLAVDRIAHWT